MNSKKLFLTSSVLIISGSIILAGGVIGKPYDTDVFCVADAAIIFGFAFLIFGLIFMLLFFFKREK